MQETDTDEIKRAMVRGTISYLEAQDLPVNKSAIFKHFQLSRSQGYRALVTPPSQRNDPGWAETRGRPSKISDEDMSKMEAILWDEQYEGVNLNWAGLAKEAGVLTACTVRTLHRAMGTLGYRRCLRCTRSWVHRRNRERRVEYCKRVASATATEAETDASASASASGNWRRVRFSGELHFGFGADGRVRIVPRQGERLCGGCAVNVDVNMHDGSMEGGADTGNGGGGVKDVRVISAWCALGSGFKSDLVFYKEPLDLKTYRDKILDGVVKGWTQRGDGFLLVEDVDVFAHGSGSKSNIVQSWKEKHPEVQCRFGCSESPDLSPLDSVWENGKEWQREDTGDWSEEALKKAAVQAWDALAQERVDLWVAFMPSRLKQVVESEGGMVHW